MPSVFISHSSKDKKFVAILAKALNDRGIVTWVDDWRIKVGQPIPGRIAQGISRSDFFLIVLSQAATESRWVENELNSAYFEATRQSKDSVLPVLLEKVEIPTLLRSVKYADFSESFDKGLNDLLGSLEINEDEIPFLTTAERRANIKSLLTTVNKSGELPTEAIAMVEDESYLDLFGENLDIKADRRLLRNSLLAILSLASGWDGRFIRRHQLIGPLLQLYQDAAEAGDLQIEKEVVSALCGMDSIVTRDFLIRILAKKQPIIVAEILSIWQGMHNWGDSSVWVPRILPVLHRFTRLPQEQCLYFDHDGIEQDFRFWVFRCLQGLKRRGSRSYIEEFISSVKSPTETLVEAAMAHWCVTGSDLYIPILRRASRSGNSNSKYFLKKIREYNSSQKRKQRQ